MPVSVGEFESGGVIVGFQRAISQPRLDQVLGEAIDNSQAIRGNHGAQLGGK
jgi:hypothetical protein